jgi:5-oxoprolinase (ATP-hydrolysing) subunit A
MTRYIDLNCDMGESYGRWTLGNDEEVMPHLTSANLACGFHAGDPHIMRRTVDLAMRHDVAIGAHPGLPDLLGFGRRVLNVSPDELKDYIHYQTGALSAFARVAGAQLQHVKPHGIQYTMFERNLDLARACAEAVGALDPNLILMTMADTKFDAAARSTGVRVAGEGFADRPYTRDRELVWPRALITDPDRAAEQAVMMAKEGRVRTHDGDVVDVNVQTICVHGDTPGAEKIVAAVRKLLEQEGISVKPLRDWLPGAPSA